MTEPPTKEERAEMVAQLPHLPKKLSGDALAGLAHFALLLFADLERAEAERDALKADLGQCQCGLDAALAERDEFCRDNDRAQAEVARLRDIISPGDAAAYEEGMAALGAKLAALEFANLEAADWQAQERLGRLNAQDRIAALEEVRQSEIALACSLSDRAAQVADEQRIAAESKLARVVAALERLATRASRLERLGVFAKASEVDRDLLIREIMGAEMAITAAKKGEP